MNVLVTAASRHGSTEEIAHAIARRLRARGLEAREAHPDLVALDGIDAVVVGSAVYAGKWLPAARSFVREHAEELRERPVWTFSSGPVGDPPRPLEESTEGVELATLVGARAHRTITGRVDPGKLGIAERAVVKLIRASTEDHRDWAAVESFADEIADALGQERDTSPTASA